MQRLTRRWRTSALLTVSMALAAFAFSASPASATDLRPGVPDQITGGWFDDHSISGDNHAAWGPHDQPLAVRFRAGVVNAGAAIAFCGTLHSPGWMAATQGPCGAGGPHVGWFRYVTANHFGHNRWQMLDVQRFALVRVGGSEVIWDTRWGSCINASQYSDCERNPNATAIGNMGFLPDAAKVTQDGADEDQIIAIPNEYGYRLPEGAWQLVHIVNPYGIIQGDPLANNATCARVTLTWDASPGGAESPLVIAPRVGAEPCQVPTTLPARITGPGDPNDPLRYARAFPITCQPTASGHCWTTHPLRCSAEHPTARTFISGALVPAVDPCAPGGGGGGSNGGGQPGTSPIRGLSQRAARLRITTRLAKRYAPQALRKTLKMKRTPRGVRRSCRVTNRVTARCTIRWQSRTRRVSGRMYIRFVAGSERNRWTYRADLRSTNRRTGRTTRIRHKKYRTGGRLAS